jgi:hypothetical protein
MADIEWIVGDTVQIKPRVMRVARTARMVFNHEHYENVRLFGSRRAKPPPEHKTADRTRRAKSTVRVKLLKMLDCLHASLYDVLRSRRGINRLGREGM